MKIQKKFLLLLMFLLTVSSCAKTATVEGQGFLKTAGGDVKTCAGEVVSLFLINDYYSNVIYRSNAIKIEMKLAEYRSKADFFENNKNNQHIYQLAYREVDEMIWKLRSDYPKITFRVNYDKQTFEEDLQKVKDFEIKNLGDSGSKINSIAESQCDASGNFNLKNIPFGNYEIVTRVSWTNGREMQGGKVGKSITVNDKLQKVFITDPILP